MEKMNKVIVDPGFWEIFPQAHIFVLAADGIDNHDSAIDRSERAQLLKKATVASRQFTEIEPFSANPVVAQWRDAYRQFKKKKGARASIEALLKRAAQGHEFEPIEPLVDVYNAVSMTYGVPVGIEDRNKIDGDMHLGVAKGGEAFLPLGAESDEPALPGEVCYMDNAGAVCRCLNWREAQRTMLTEDSTDVVALIEAVNDEQTERGRQAIGRLKELFGSVFGVSAGEPQELTKDHPEALVI